MSGTSLLASLLRLVTAIPGGAKRMRSEFIKKGQDLGVIICIGSIKFALICITNRHSCRLAAAPSRSLTHCTHTHLLVAYCLLLSNLAHIILSSYSCYDHSSIL